MPPVSIRGLSLTLGFALSACGSTNSGWRERLPFHVALLPVMVSQSAPEPGAEAEGIPFRIDAEEVRSRMQEVLGERCFARVSTTEVAPSSAADDLAAHIDDALERGADLVLVCSIVHDPLVRARRNEKFWLNLPLFLLGGPFCYFIDDHTYVGRARLGASLQDLHPLVEGRAALGDGRSEYAYLEGRVADPSLDFIDRASPSVGAYLLSLVVPSGLIAGNGPGVDNALARSAADELAQALADEILRSTDSLRSSARVCPFFLGDDVQVLVDEQSTLVRGRILTRASSPEPLGHCMARLGDSAVRFDFERTGAPIYGSSLVEFPFELRLPGTGPDVRLEVHGRGRDPLLRTYTLRTE